MNCRSWGCGANCWFVGETMDDLWEEVENWWCPACGSLLTSGEGWVRTTHPHPLHHRL